MVGYFVFRVSLIEASSATLLVRRFDQRLACVVVLRGHLELTDERQRLLVHSLVVAHQVFCKGANLLVLRLLQRQLSCLDVDLPRRIRDRRDLGVIRLAALCKCYG